MNSASGSASGLGEDPVRPSLEHYVVPSASGAMSPQLRRKHWTMFAAGNLIAAAVIIAEILQLLDLSLDDCVGGGYDGAQGILEVAELPHNPGASPRAFGVVTLRSGLMLQGYFSTVLSLVYRSPLDIKSVHKIPPEAMVSRGNFFHVCCLAAFSWAWTYLLGGAASLSFSGNIPCDWQGGSGLGIYLKISGLVMVFVGIIFSLLSLVGWCFSLASPFTSTLYTSVRKIISERILSKGMFLDVVWRLQGVVWVYRAGRFE